MCLFPLFIVNLLCVFLGLYKVFGNPGFGNLFCRFGVNFMFFGSFWRDWGWERGKWTGKGVKRCGKVWEGVENSEFGDLDGDFGGFLGIFGDLGASRQAFWARKGVKKRPETRVRRSEKVAKKGQKDTIWCEKM